MINDAHETLRETHNKFLQYQVLQTEVRGAARHRDAEDLQSREVHRLVTYTRGASLQLRVEKISSSSIKAWTPPGGPSTGCATGPVDGVRKRAAHHRHRRLCRLSPDPCLYVTALLPRVVPEPRTPLCQLVPLQRRLEVRVKPTLRPKQLNQILFLSRTPASTR